MIKNISIIASVLLLSSCGTLSNQSKIDPIPYGGIKESLENIGGVNDPFSAAIMIIDIPLSLVGDTIMLYSDIKEGDIHRYKTEGSHTPSAPSTNP
ncbi:MAG: YceK/YidQ family lipoprotein [Gammaproteobacteria bacterium]|nr:MAG: YceK/YidQ family lipoprotein [Gammaproteobacteria bacterium]